MEKKLVYIFSDGADYNGIVFEELGAVTEWIKADIEGILSDEDLSDREYTVRLAWMTEEDIQNLPEAE